LKLFQCDHCGQALSFENSACARCRKALGYAVEADKLVVLPEEASEPNRPFQVPALGTGWYLECRNYSEHQACNWLVQTTRERPSGEAGLKPPYCRSCELTEVIPDLSDPDNLQAWVKIERAKRRLLYTLAGLKLPAPSKHDAPTEGLSFRFLRGTEQQPVMTGHSSGVVTLNIAEANAAFRENMREKLGEAYRTVLGHLRHEIGHYYWDRLVAGTAAHEPFVRLFGDERQDYQKAIARHYDEGPPSDWAESFISAYASMHPWEDWAETWAHYLHLVDTLETAKSHGVSVRVPGKSGVELIATDALAFRDFESLAEGWHAVTATLNGLSRSMGLEDAYPFVLSGPVHDKLRFIHQLIVERPAAKSTRRAVPPAPPSRRGRSTAPVRAQRG
jgi:hypothetical protein